MKLLIDIGNSRAKYLFAFDGEFSDSKIIDNKNLTSAWLEQYTGKVAEVIVGNVGPAVVLTEINNWTKRHNIRYTSIVSEKSNHGVTSCYQIPEKLGVDRWLALIGAVCTYPQKNTLLIDAGTATTIDVVNCTGQHLGGWILPGINMLRNSFAKQTTNVAVDISRVGELTFGSNTNDCVNNACWSATIGYINMAIEEANSLLALDHVVILGGNASALASHIKYPVQVNQGLIFQGLIKYSH